MRKPCEVKRPAGPVVYRKTVRSNGDRALRPLTAEQQRLVSENIGLVGLHLRNRVRGPSQPTRHREHEDLYQEGCLALARAAARYNPGADGEFGAYALARIRGAVFAALHERFSLIRVPPHALRHPDHTVTVNSLENAAGLSVATSPHKAGCLLPDHGERKTIRHALRERFESAVRFALSEVRSRRSSKRNPFAIMVRIVHERLLVDASESQTPLRQIAREIGTSSGRVSAYEKQLLTRIHEILIRDPLLPLLVSMARREKAGLAAIIDRTRQEQLRRAQCDAFVRRFRGLERSEQTDTLCHMIERSGVKIEEVARNLYQLTRMEETEPLPIPA